jgi:hypothetical protein
MADGILDGISNAVGGVGDFFLNRGRYADPNAMNAQFGVPEADVRQAGINTLANVSALLLAAGQPMSGSERAKLLAGIGPALGGMQRDIMQSTQARRAAQLFPLQKQQLEQTVSGQQLEQQIKRQQLAQSEAERIRRQNVIRQLTGLPPLPVPSSATPTAPVPPLSQQVIPSSVGVASAPQAPSFSAPQASPVSAPAAPSAQQPAAVSPAEMSILEELPREYLLQQLSDPSVKLQDIYKEAFKQRGESEKTTFERSDKLRDEFNKVAVPFNDRQTAFKTMVDLSKNKAGASDMALVLSIMKVYDPSSTVTGSEAATAQNAAGVPSLVAGYYNRLVGGGVLDEKARADLVRAAETRFEQEMDKFENDVNRYTGLAKRAKVAPEDVIEDFRDPELKAARQKKKDFDLASKRITKEEIGNLDAATLELLNPSLMNSEARDAYKARVNQLTSPSRPRPAPTPADQSMLQRPTIMGQNPLGARMQQFPGGLLRADELPTPRF